jgi:hypothetical protein
MKEEEIIKEGSKECTFAPKINTKPKERRDLNTFLESQKNHEDKKNQKINMKLEETTKLNEQ